VLVEPVLHETLLLVVDVEVDTASAAATAANGLHAASDIANRTAINPLNEVCINCMLFPLYVYKNVEFALA